MWQKLVNWFKNLFSSKPQIHHEANGLWWQKDNNIIKIGLDSKIIDELGEISFLDTPQVNEHIQKDDQLIDIEGGKAVETFNSPFAGKIIDVRSEFQDDPSLLSSQSNPVLVTVEI